MSHLFEVFKVAENREPVLLETIQNLDDAMAWVAALRENFPGEYLIVSQGTRRQIMFTSNGGIKRT